MLSLNYENINCVMTQILKFSCASFSYVNISYVLAEIVHCMTYLLQWLFLLHRVIISTCDTFFCFSSIYGPQWLFRLKKSSFHCIYPKSHFLQQLEMWGKGLIISTFLLGILVSFLISNGINRLKGKTICSSRVNKLFSLHIFVYEITIKVCERNRWRAWPSKSFWSPH